MNTITMPSDPLIGHTIEILAKQNMEIVFSKKDLILYEDYRMKYIIMLPVNNSLTFVLWKKNIWSITSNSGVFYTLPIGMRKLSKWEKLKSFFTDSEIWVQK